VLRFTAAVPVLVAMHPTLTTHQYALLDNAARCRANDGERPIGFRTSMVRSNYYAVTPIGDRLLLTGEDLPRWLVREPNGRLRFAEASRVRGNYWSGSVGEGSAFFVHRDELRIVRWGLDGEDMSVIDLRRVRAPSEADLINSVYDPATRTVFAGEFIAGGLVRIPLSRRRPSRLGLDMFYLQLANGEDGTILASSSSDLAVIDARTGHIRERHPAALCTGSIASCPLDHAVAVTDYAGRVRLFERDARGHYAFVRSGAMMSPRRVVFSPDCRALAVASADDETISVLRRRDLRVVESYHVGPSLRDLAWLPSGDLLIVDACTVTRVRP
jgi:hypothetical protein